MGSGVDPPFESSNLLLVKRLTVKGRKETFNKNSKSFLFHPKVEFGFVESAADRMRSESGIDILESVGAVGVMDQQHVSGLVFPIFDQCTSVAVNSLSKIFH